MNDEHVKNSTNSNDTNKGYQCVENNNYDLKHVSCQKVSTETASNEVIVFELLESSIYNERIFTEYLKNSPSVYTGKYLSKQFEKPQDDEKDKIICKYIELYISLYPVESQDLFIEEISNRLYDLRKDYYERGCRIMKLITDKSSNKNLNLKNDQIKIKSEKEYTDEIRKEIIICIDAKKPEKLEKYKNYIPHSIQECQNQLRKNKYSCISRLCLYYMPILISKTTQRMLKMCSLSLFETLINYNEDKIDDLNILKINAITSIISYSYNNISQSIMNNIKTGSYIGKLVLISALTNSINKIDLFTLIDILENFCIIYVPNKLTNEITTIFIQQCIARLDGEQKYVDLGYAFLEKIESCF